MTNTPLDIENILQKLGIEINKIKVDKNQLKKEFFDMDFLLKTKKANHGLERYFYANILLCDSSFFKQINPSIRLKIKIISSIAHSLGYRI